VVLLSVIDQLTERVRVMAVEFGLESAVRNAFLVAFLFTRNTTSAESAVLQAIEPLNSSAVNAKKSSLRNDGEFPSVPQMVVLNKLLPATLPVGRNYLSNCRVF
jgi:hypothetical protein